MKNILTILKNCFRHFLLFFALITVNVNYVQGQIIIWSEDFEEAGNDTYTTNQNTIPGLSNQWEYAKTNDGRLRMQAGAGFYHSGTNAATLDANSTGTYSQNYLIATIDLGAYENSLKLFLSFAYMDHGDETHPEDIIQIRRGDNSDNNAWIDMYSFNPAGIADGTWTQINDFNIASYLSSQTASNTLMQIRIGQYDNYAATSINADDGITIDDISLTGYISTLNYSTSFEDCGIDWTNNNSLGDDIDWTCNSGGTPSGSTGPNGASDGSWYLYTEASSNTNKDAYLERSFDLSSLSNPVIFIDYHMYGQNMGSFHIDVNDGSGWDTDLLILVGQQHTSNGDNWSTAEVDISAYAGVANAKVRLRGITGNNYRSDIAIDNFRLYDFSTSPPAPTRKYYSYQTGNWHDATTWTLDPSGTTYVNPDTEVPDSDNDAYILNGRTVSASGNTSAKNLSVEYGAVLDLRTFTHSYSAVEGKGLIRINSTNFPSGNFSDFVSSEGGTIEFYDVSGNLPNQTIYNNLLLTNSTASTNNLVFQNSSNITYTINGNFTINNSGTGELKATLGTGVANRITFNINKNFSIGEGCYFLIAHSNNLIHNLNIYGDLTDNGVLNLNNFSDYTYSSGGPGNRLGTTATEGAAIISFMGESDNTVTVNTNTRFYTCRVNKGTDQTYVLNVVASNANSDPFRGYDQYNDIYGNTGAGTITTISGTIKLNENLEIARLTPSNGDLFFVSSTGDGNGCLWINGANVINYGSHVAIYGLLRVSAGSLDVRSSNKGAILSRANGQFTIEGGIVSVCNYRTSAILATLPKGGFTMTGGLLDMPGDQNTNDGSSNQPKFSIPYITQSFTMTGGEINIRGVSYGGYATNGGLLINVDSYEVSGGTLNIYTPTRSDIIINSTAPFYNVNIYNQAGGTNEVHLANQPWNGGGGNQIASARSLIVLNTFTIDGTNAPEFVTNGHNVTVGGDFIISTGATYTPGSNTTIFNGSSGQEFKIEGTISGGLNNLTLSNTTATVITPEAGTSLDVNGTLTIDELCSIDDNGNTITASGTIYNAGTHKSNGGVLLLNGGSTQQIQGNGSGIFGNLELDNANGAVFYADQIVTNTLTLTNGVLDIDIYTLKIYNSANNAVVGTFGSGEMIKTAGNQSDGGVLKIFGDAPNNTFTFPIGTGSEYTPATITVDAAMQGNVIVKPSSKVHPLADDAANNTLQYYWKVESEYFSGVNTVNSVFSYDNSDIETSDADYYAAVYSPYQWTKNNVSPTYVNAGSNEVNFETVQIDGEFTAGQTDAFGTLTVFYSKVDNGDWNTNTTWSNNVDRTGTASVVPGAGDPVVIGGNGYNHTIIVGANNASSGSLEINSGSTLDLQTYTGHNFGTLPNQTVGGTGTLRISSSATTAEFPQGDFGAFINQEGGTVEYYTNGTSFTLPENSADGLNLSTYNNVSLMAAGTNVITLPNIDLRVYNDMTAGATGFTNIVRLNSSSEKTLTINNDLNVNAGTLQFNNNNAQEVIIDNDINIANGATFEVRNANTAVANLLNISGNISNNGTFDLYTNPYYCNLTFSGNTDNTFGGTGTGGTTLNMLTIDKGSNQSAVLTMNVGGTLNTLTNNWLTLSNGTFRFASASKSITLTDQNNAIFTIPSSACLSVDGTGSQINIGYANDDDCDLYLYGKLDVKTGTINIGNSANTGANNDIEYASAGLAEINIENGGNLFVNGQIRYNLTTTSGALIYNQSGGNVTIYGYDDNASRAKLAVHNSGSIFNMSDGTITIKAGGGTTFSDLYLRPESSTVTGGTILFDANATETYGIDANVPIYNLSLIGGTSNTTNINVNPLELLGDLSIDSNSELVSNNLDVSIGGSFTLNGVYTPGTNTTIFNGRTTQSITCNNSVNFYNVSIASTGSVLLEGADDPVVSNNFDLLSGTFDTYNRNIEVEGNVTNSSTHASSGIGIFYLTGNNPQIISGDGTGQFANISIDNLDGIILDADLSISKQLNFDNGMFYANEHLLSFTADAPIPTGYDETKFIALSGVSSDKGIRKMLNAGDNDFTFPIGCEAALGNKYTPAQFDLNGVSGTNPYILLRSINMAHLSTTDASDLELSYYWNLSTSAGLTVSSLSQTYTYLDEDIQGTESSYVAGRLPYGESNWIKDGSVDDATNTITFTNASDIGGDYTAGETSEFLTSYVYRSRVSGNWTTPASWEKDEDGDGIYEVSPSDDYPQGNKAIIQAPHTITSTADGCASNHLELYGGLDLGNTVQHNFASLLGDGLLKIGATPAGAFIFPGGNADVFMNTNGATVEYNSTTGSTQLPIIDSYQNIRFTGAGQKTLSNCDLLIKGSLTIEAGKLDNSQYSVSIDIYGNWINNGTAHTPGLSTVSFNGNTAQLVGGAVAEAFYNLIVDNANGLSLEQDIAINNDLTINSGSSFDGDDNIISISGDWTNNSSIQFIAGTSTVNFNGTGSQNYYGQSGETFYNLIVSNANGITANCNSTINGNIDLVSNDGHKLIIGSNELALTSASGAILNYGANSFIKTNGLAGDGGIVKNVVDNYTCTFPIGVDSKYTPVTFNESGTGSNGTIKVIPVNSSHPFTNNSISYELQYYWIVEASAGITVSNLNQTFTYDVNDLDPNSNNFITGRFYNNAWNKSEGSVSDPNMTFTGVNFINGEYTCGIPSNFGDILIYYSRNNAPLITTTGADWRSTSTWSTKGHNDNVYIPNTIPDANSVIIASGHKVIAYDDGINIASLELEGELNIQSTANHDFGSITGTGTLIVENNASNDFVLPEANMNSFTATATGGTIEFSGSGDLPDNTKYNNLVFSGTGTKRMANVNITVNGFLQIAYGVLNNYYSKNIVIKRNWIEDPVNGRFSAGAGTVTFRGTVNQEITANSNTKFNNLEVNNSFGITLLSAVEVANELLLTDGLIHTTATNILLLSNSDADIVTGGSNTSHVNGPLNKVIATDGRFSFPVGANNIYTPISLSNCQTDTWQAQYYRGDYNSASFTAPVVDVSDEEYWRVKSLTGSKTAKVTLPYANSTAISMKWAVVEYSIGGIWNNNLGSSVNSGNQTVTTNTIASFNIFGDGNYYTLGESNLIYWLGTVDNYWDNANNWSSGSIPDQTDNAVIDITYQTNNCIIANGRADGVCKNLIIENGTTLTIQSTKQLSVYGNWNNSGILSASAGSNVIFNGSQQQQIGGTGTNAFSSITANNSTPSVAIELTNPISVDETLTLTDGHIITDATNILTLGVNATVNLNGVPQDSSFVKGPMSHTVATSASITKVFPIGKDSVFRPVELTVDQDAATSTLYTAEAFNSSAEDLAYTLPLNINRVSTYHYYHIGQEATGVGLDGATVKFIYHNFDNVPDPNYLRIVKDDGAGGWMDIGGTGSMVSSGEITSGSFTSFSDFALANDVAGSNPLPIELLSFSGAENGNIIELNWVTATEINNDYFEIQRSIDGISFSTIGVVAGNGTTMLPSNYSYVDINPANGTNYYRLKQVDYDGAIEYHNVIALSYNSTQKGSNNAYINIYPNPYRDGSLTLNLKEFEAYSEINLSIADVDGKTILNTTLNVIANKKIDIIPSLVTKLNKGIYLVKVKTHDKVLTQYVIVQ